MKSDSFEDEFSISSILFEDNNANVGSTKVSPYFFVSPEKVSKTPKRSEYLFTGTLSLRKILEGYGIDPDDYPAEKVAQFKEGRLIGEPIERTIAYWLNKHHATFKGKVSSLPTMSEYDLAIDFGIEKKLIEVRLITTTGVLRLQASKLGSTAYTGEKDSQKKLGLVYHTNQKVAKSFGYIFADVRNFQTSPELVGTYDVYFVPSEYLIDLMVRGFFGVKGEKQFFKKKEDAFNPEKTKNLNRFLSGELDPSEISQEKDTTAKLQFLKQTEQKIASIDEKLQQLNQQMMDIKKDKEVQALFFALSSKRSIGTKSQSLIGIIQMLAKTFRAAFDIVKKEYELEKQGKPTPMIDALDKVTLTGQAGKENVFSYESTGLETLVSRTSEIESLVKKFDDLNQQKEQILTDYHDKIQNVRGVAVSSVEEIENYIKPTTRKRKPRKPVPAVTKEPQNLTEEEDDDEENEEEEDSIIRLSEFCFSKST